MSTWWDGVHCSGFSALSRCALAPFCLTSNKDMAAFNQISHEFTAAYAACILSHVRSHKAQAGEGREAVTPLGLQSVLSDRKKVPRPINFQIKHCLLAPILSLVIKGVTWRWLLYVSHPSKVVSLFSPTAPLVSLSWCSSQLVCHVSKHAPCRAEYAQTCPCDFSNCTVASLFHLTKQVLAQKGWVN